MADDKDKVISVGVHTWAHEPTCTHLHTAPTAPHPPVSPETEAKMLRQGRDTSPRFYTQHRGVGTDRGLIMAKLKFLPRRMGGERLPLLRAVVSGQSASSFVLWVYCLSCYVSKGVRGLGRRISV